MKVLIENFDLDACIHDLAHYLPAQAPLKDFIHHNTLHAFQHDSFFQALAKASRGLGYKSLLHPLEYLKMLEEGRISEAKLKSVFLSKNPDKQFESWLTQVKNSPFDVSEKPRIGTLRANWKKKARIDLDSMVHPLLFRILCSYLDQGIASWKFPLVNGGFIASIRSMERNSLTSIFRTEQARNLLLDETVDVYELLDRVVGRNTWFESYLYDQQFGHAGWSGLVATVEMHPHTLIDHRPITLKQLIHLELLLEYDALIYQFGKKATPLSSLADFTPQPLFEDVPKSFFEDVQELFQEAFEWSYYDQVLQGIRQSSAYTHVNESVSFQAIFCIDDRECSLRRHLEATDSFCQTYGTPGFFGVEFYFKSDQGKHYTKLCPAPVSPKYLIRETESSYRREQDALIQQRSHSMFKGWFISHYLGFWSAFKLFLNIFKPSISPATATSLRHMDKVAKLSIEHPETDGFENGLQVGFTPVEMADRVERLLRSIGLVNNFATLIYIVGHGASSVNNPHYSAYDCGACSGRPGSVNARVVCYMANHLVVRQLLRERGIDIPEKTRFVGALHDTTRDDIVYFDEEGLGETGLRLHLKYAECFDIALDLNAQERSRRLESVHTGDSPEKIHEKLRIRSVSLFEPRPELNHATNTLCIVGRRKLTRDLFLDRRSFLNSYDYRIDENGDLLYGILRAAAPVCGGINLEYFFSRVDNEKLGAGTKLPHNVMGLIGVANGTDGDLRPGLPSQMIEVHDPLRLLILVEQTPDKVLGVIQRDDATYEWFKNSWVHLIAIEPSTRDFYRFVDDHFVHYNPEEIKIEQTSNLHQIFEDHPDNLPVYLLRKEAAV